MTTKPSGGAPKGDVVATFADKSPAVTINTVGSGKSVHFYWFVGTSNVFSAQCSAHAHGWCSKYPANVSGTPFQADMLASQQTVRALLWNVTVGLGGVVPPVTTNALAIEAPLLEGPTGSVVTLLNWGRNTSYPFFPGGKNGSSIPSAKPLTVNVVLGFTPSRAESVEHGALTVALIPGQVGAVTVTLPLAGADMLLFHK
jgi:hypothetical protein